MFVYEKKLQYPVRIKNPDPAMAKYIISQYGGPDGELSASLRYLSQRYSMPYPEVKAILTDIGVEELGHLEMVGTIVHQLTRNMTVEQVKKAGFQDYFVDHTAGVYAQAAGGWPYSAATFQVKGDVIADLAEDMGADGAMRKGQREEIRWDKLFTKNYPTERYFDSMGRFFIRRLHISLYAAYLFELGPYIRQ